LSLALDRAGYWFVEIFGESGGKAGVQRVDSWDLGTLVLKRIEESIPAIPDGVLADPEKASGKELKFLEDVLRYAAVVHFVAQCHETMMRAVEEQEKRLRIIRERVGLIGQLAGALDPLQSGRRTAKLPHCAMYLEHNLGTSAVAGTYFSRAALQPFWEFVKGRLMPAGERYSESVGASSLDSLETFSFLMRFCFKDIREALERGRQGADSVFGYSSGRLPLTPDEVEALKEFVTSLE
jgi:hypothetical protein